MKVLILSDDGTELWAWWECGEGMHGGTSTMGCDLSEKEQNLIKEIEAAVDKVMPGMRLDQFRPDISGAAVCYSTKSRDGITTVGVDVGTAPQPLQSANGALGAEYLGDDYPREGCSIVVRVKPGNFVIEMRAPGARYPIEIYGCRDPAAMQEVVGWLATGRLVPKGYNKADQLP